MSNEPAQFGKPAGGRGMLIVVSSPSGGGKGTLIDRARKLVPDLSYSVSYTTRQPRPGEVDGREYFFVSLGDFEVMKAEGRFLEWAWVHGNLYGTSREQVINELAEGSDIILEIDVQGASSVRALMNDAVCIFILPPSFAILRERLITRGTDSPADLERRLQGAPAEVEHYREFQYVIINDDIERASAQLAAIIFAERARRERQQEQLQLVLRNFPEISNAV
ncbi:MAG: guanylate kinase [Blastocatellia bacterium]|jgi:guanylate kinase|nr:guanylate kinase [Blastocatellia bacterium]